MADQEKPVSFGATIVNPNADTLAQPAPALRPIPSSESALSSHSVGAEKDTAVDTAVDASNPFSAFYKHPNARRSMDESAQLSKTHLDVTERDLEACTPLSAATTQNPKVSVDGRVKECTMWPSRQAMMDKKRATKRAKGCAWFRNLNSKQRLWAKIIIALIIVAAAVGLGVGISRAVGGGVWSGNGKSKQIPNN